MSSPAIAEHWIRLEAAFEILAKPDEFWPLGHFFGFHHRSVSVATVADGPQSFGCAENMGY